MSPFPRVRIVGETACGVQSLEKYPVVEKELQPWFAKG
jgi:hypothetical protein